MSFGFAKAYFQSDLHTNILISERFKMASSKTLVSNGHRTKISPTRSVTIRVLIKSDGSPVCLSRV